MENTRYQRQQSEWITNLREKELAEAAMLANIDKSVAPDMEKYQLHRQLHSLLWGLWHSE